MKKLAIVTTHPIQYHVPWLTLLRERQIKVKVFYTWEQSAEGIYDPGFGKKIQWDIPLLEGYEHQFVRNISPRPGSHHFLGVINPGLNEAIESWGPDSLMIIGWSFYSHLQCMRYFHNKIPVSFRGDSVLLHERKGLKRMARRIVLTWVYKHIDRALYVGSHNRSYYLRHGLKPSQLVFSPHAIDIERFSEPADIYTPCAEAWKKELGIPSHHIVVLFAGKMTKTKNPDFVLDLADTCRDLPVSFIFVGNGQLCGALRERARNNTKVHFLDFQNQTVMPVIYRMGDIYIMPSLHETWGMGVNEAMACGRPVMASDKVGCAADLILENKTGITFALGDVLKCARFLDEVCRDRSKLAEMSRASKALIRHFSFSNIADSIAQSLDIPLKPRPLKYVHSISMAG